MIFVLSNSLYLTKSQCRTFASHAHTTCLNNTHTHICSESAGGHTNVKQNIQLYMYYICIVLSSVYVIMCSFFGRLALGASQT